MHRSVSKITGINLILVLDFLRTFLSYRISILYVEPYYAGQRGSLNLNLGHPLSSSLWGPLSPLHFGPPLSTSLWTTLSPLHLGPPSHNSEKFLQKGRVTQMRTWSRENGCVPRHVPTSASKSDAN